MICLILKFKIHCLSDIYVLSATLPEPKRLKLDGQVHKSNQAGKHRRTILVLKSKPIFPNPWIKNPPLASNFYRKKALNRSFALQIKRQAGKGMSHLTFSRPVGQKLRAIVEKQGIKIHILPSHNAKRKRESEGMYYLFFYLKIYFIYFYLKIYLFNYDRNDDHQAKI